MEDLSDKHKQEGFFPSDYMHRIKLASTEHQSLKDLFLVPPFSVLDTRQGYWQNRKREWIKLGIQGELGRGERLLHKSETGREWEESYKGGDCWAGASTSIFDPVLCEFMYRWFCFKGGVILDPFAGGSVRGIVAGFLGYRYIGVDLSAEQVKANKEQAEKILGASLDRENARWIVGDSRDLSKLVDEQFDFIFSCPPYFDLEIYSDDKRDLSNAASYEQFIETYNDIIAQSVRCLKNNRFACFVVAGMRDKQGFYRNFVSDTIKAFIDAGMKLYNEAILITSVGSLPIRIGRQFRAGRKLGKTHQNVLGFYKGNPKEIKAIFGEDVETEAEKKEPRVLESIEISELRRAWQGLYFGSETIKRRQSEKLTEIAPEPEIGQSGALFRMGKIPETEQPQRWQGLKFKRGL